MCEVIDFSILQISIFVKSMVLYIVVGGGKAACRERQRSRASPYYKIRMVDFVNASPTLFLDQFFRVRCQEKLYLRSKFCILRLNFSIFLMLVSFRAINIVKRCIELLTKAGVDSKLIDTYFK